MDLYTKNTISENRVFKTLRERGYYINVIKSGYAVTGSFEHADNMYQPSGLNELERTMLNNTVFIINDLIGSTAFYRLRNQLKSIDLFINNKGKQFNFIHIVAPHPPYVFDQNGNKVNFINKSVNEWDPKSKYLNQLKYISKVILSKIKKIKKTNPKAIIILQSDHGPMINSEEVDEVFINRALVLSAIYGPEKLKLQFKKTKTTVNTFVHVFNFLFSQNNRLIEDDLAGKETFIKNEISIKN